MKTKTIEYDA